MTIPQGVAKVAVCPRKVNEIGFHVGLIESRARLAPSGAPGLGWYRRRRGYTDRRSWGR
jgi:hypothetical protein